jgi:hypothetical protein
MNKEAQKLYNLLLDTGELLELFPKATINWEEDKNFFIQYYNQNLKMLEEFEKNYEEVDNND